MDYTDLLEYLQSRQPAMLQALEELVEQESPSTDKNELDALARHLQSRFQAIGAGVSMVPNQTAGDHVEIGFPADVGSLPSGFAFILGHYDTVWPMGSLSSKPFRVEGEKARGPGVFDMKAGIVITEFALEAIAKLGLELPRPVVILFTSDEEVGSTTSRQLIEELAKQAEYTLVMEPSLPGGVLKTARKGVGKFVLEVDGRAAHAGVEPEKGISAIQEIANQILHLHQLGDPSTGTTVNVGVLKGGTRPNVVAAHAEVEIDARVWTSAEAERIETAVLDASPFLSGAKIQAIGGFARPPMERTPEIAGLFERAQAIGLNLGIELVEGSTGGASDGNFTAALGIPTLDGLGAVGDGAHAEHEHIDIACLPERAALLAALLANL